MFYGVGVSFERPPYPANSGHDYDCDSVLATNHTRICRVNVSGYKLPANHPWGRFITPPIYR